MSFISDFVALTKLRLLPMVIVSVLIGYSLAGGEILNYSILPILLSIAFVAGGAAALNAYLERDVDALMQRTCQRPLPRGSMRPRAVFVWGFTAVIVGVIGAAFFANIVTSVVMGLAAVLYVAVYTPLKKISWLNTAVGAIPGALPIVAGWTAVAGQISGTTFLLFFILFFWQFPHFYPIAWMYAEDYKKANIKMLPGEENGESRAIKQILFFLVLLTVTALIPTWLGLTSYMYFFGVAFLSSAFLAAGVFLALNRTVVEARALMRVSLLYLPLMLILILIDGGLS